MADNFGGGENIFYTDDANIVLIDPNSIVDRSGKKQNRTIKQEDLVMYANLEVQSVPRTKLAVGQSVDSGVSNFTIASINFLKPQGKNTFDTSYTEQLTGGRNGQGRINQLSFDNNFNPQQQNYVDTQLLGISSISVDILSNGIPSVNMQLIDIQGRALFETGGNSPYSVFLYYPYPLFRLTLKGYYGKAIQYELMLKSFNASFDQSKGNYNIDLQFIARTSAILDDIRLGYLFALPNMFPIYKTQENATPNTSQEATASLNQVGTDVTQQSRVELSSKGYSKLVQVFDEYRKKNLIDKQVPTLTLDAMSKKLEKYTQFLNEQYQQLDFTNVVALERYTESIDRYFRDIRKWRGQFISEADVIALEDSTRMYGLKNITPVTNEQDTTSQANNLNVSTTATTELETYTKKNQGEIESVPVWGKKIATPKDFFQIKQFQRKFTSDDINFVETYFLRTGRNVVNTKTDEDFKAFKEQINNELLQKGTFQSEENSQQSSPTDESPYYYTFDKFEKATLDLGEVIAQRNQEENDRLNEQFQNKIKRSGTSGLNFRPTIRNVVGVIMASVDAFYRLMDDVHEQAWNQRNNKNRINSIIKSNSPSQDGKSSVETSSKNITNVIYPWPQFVQKKEVVGNTEYQISYPGSKSVVGFTKGYDITVWPEVNFVEQFLYGLTIKETQYNSTAHNTTKLTINYTPSSAIEFKFKDDIYVNTEVYTYIYEMYERILLNTFYSGLYYEGEDGWTNEPLIPHGTNMEISNITKSNISNGLIIDVLKNKISNISLYDYLKTTGGANQEGELWGKFQEQIYNTGYINEEIVKSTELFSENTYAKNGRIPVKLETADAITKYIGDYSSTNITLFDTYPFVITDFQKKLEPPNNSNKFFNTVNTYVLDPGNLFITNEKNEIRPYTKPSSVLSGFTGENTYSSINDFYRVRHSDGTKRLLTEGVLTNPDTKINGTTTTSMLNTPYFLNSLLQEGTGDTFYRSSYLFLNSLPLSTLYEKYLDTKNRNKDEHIFPSLTKFSAVHKLPYAWILKLGSVWYRYKKYINGGGDILKDVWKDFDYQNAYDPTTNNISKVYNIGKDGSNSKTPYSMTTPNSDNINTGFYPGLYNSVYKILTGVDLFPNNNVDGKTETFWTKNLRVTTNANILQSTQPRGPITPSHSYFNITNDYSSVFGSESVNKILLFPSAGYLPFLEAYFSVSSNFQQVTKSQVDNPNMYNGSARTFWLAPNYGWFDSTSLKKPSYNEYLKYIYTARTSNQDEFHFFSEGTEPNQEYAKIEDLFGVFDKQQLDLFENEFITFSRKGSISSLFTESDTPETKYTNFREILKRILIIDNVPTVDSQTLANAQSTAISNVLSKFLDISVYLKIGNPKKFDRIQFGNFIDSSDEIVNRMKPKTAQNYGSYIQNTLPGSGQTVTLAESQTNYPDEWKALQLNVGFSTIEGIQYTNKQSYIYDFFIQNDIAFTVNNIEKLSKLIQIYATQKYIKGNKYDSKQFKQDITNLIQKTYTKRTNIEDQLRVKLPNSLTQGPTEGEVAITRFEGDSTKLEMWEVFKALNDKWVAGIDFNSRVLFEEFLFFDKSNRDIGDDFIVNVESIRKYCSWSNSNTSVMSLLKQLFAENRMNFFVMPAYINFYGKPYLNSSTRNQTILNNANDVFSTFGYVDYIDSSPKFLCQYIGKPSETLSMENDPKYPFKSDSFDMGVSAGNGLKNTSPVNNQFRNNKAVGFVVDFGVQNQSVFKSIEIAQNQNVTSSEQIQTVVDLGQLGGNKKTSQQTVSLFELYKNRTYDCTLKTLGNVMIQPTMYFVLRHMPMFNGTYIIRNVKHEIGPGQFNTTIKGQRMSSLSVPKVYDELAAVNEDFTKKIQNTIKTEVANNNVVTFNSESRKYLTGPDAVKYKIQKREPYQGFINQYQDVQAQPDPNNLYGSPDSNQSKLPRMNYSTRTIALENLKIDLQSVEDKNMRLFLFTLFFLSGYNTEEQSFLIKLNNIFGITGDVEWSESLLPDVSGYRSLDNKGTIVPMFGFKSIRTCLNFSKKYFELILKSNLIDSGPECTKKTGYSPTDLDVENESYKCTADIFVKMFYENWYFSPTNQKKYKDDPNYSNFISIAERALVIAGTEKLI